MPPPPRACRGPTGARASRASACRSSPRSSPRSGPPGGACASSGTTAGGASWRWPAGRGSGTAWGNRCCQCALVIVRDPKGKLDPRAYFSTRQRDEPRAIVQEFIKRWTIETTFEEGRAHLGIETGAAICGPGHRAHDALPVRALLAPRTPGESAPPRRRGADPDHSLVREEAGDLR